MHMEVKLFILIGFLCLGLIIGYFVPIPEKWDKWIEKTQFILLLLVVFLMGLKIGGDERVFKSLPELGLKAVLITVGCIGGSMLFMYIFKKIFSINLDIPNGKMKSK